MHGVLVGDVGDGGADGNVWVEGLDGFLGSMEGC